VTSQQQEAALEILNEGLARIAQELYVAGLPPVRGVVAAANFGLDGVVTNGLSTSERPEALVELGYLSSMAIDHWAAGVGEAIQRRARHA
jgi:hypothetical protein